MARQKIDKKISPQDLKEIIFAEIKDSGGISIEYRLSEFLREKYGIETSSQELADAINDLIFQEKVKVRAYVFSSADSHISAVVFVG